MACSKICSGNLVELAEEIIQYLRDDISSLYSCILVNRLWCRIAIPLLWEDPFSVPTQKFDFIKILLRSLNDEDKTRLIVKYGFNNNEFSPKTLFNYPGFIKRLNTQNIRFCIENWVPNLTNNFANSANLFYWLLFKTFIKNEINLNSFEIVMLISRDHKYFNEVFDLILKNPKFIYNIKNLILHLNLLPGVMNIVPFLNFLISNCNSISTIYFKINRCFISSIEKYLSEIILSQKNLLKISFEYKTLTLYDSLLLTLKNQNCSNTLNTIIFYCIDFENIIDNLKVINNLNVLDTIHILYCHSLNSNFIQQIISITKSFKLKSLFMSKILQIDSLQLLLQKFGNYLENFGFEFGDDEYSEPKRQLLELVVKYCTKIKYFDLAGPDDNNINPTFNLIKNNMQNLNHLFIEFDLEFDDYNLSDDVIKISSIILQNLGQILPSRLEYLCLELSFNMNDLEIFLNNSQNTFIKKLLIKNIVQDGNDNHILSFIKDFIKKKNMVKYLAFSEFLDDNYNDLFSLKDEVNEFKSYNIEVQKYSDLYIRTYDFVNN
ncbi:uncharacterized protein OCT59_000346 [Rhizophagus irregularis]|uniref:F-box domain-containing protein n=1 Tax=Rhizophagus irregularis (strain DAOM 181602 / DAOM 197198 / MUCL 43194) TaxID=747089 RepID=A0A2H5TZ06_RHIID|nr:hypothetical protein GLOIN_2v1882635 [Rhizophagus irregularis DAOM 181602=DAOM 197198]POG62760.1 hypothetical protein GLOIN_2v1882635 [Rhizophagus irregularis DAOM 181602=DAOM 197198]UZN99065.1 hypothetical protein OCT59_000346 [Rhizophagus irregularis]GBC47799.1 hypothetical protein GLOIN_2v1882635 [Rhizophagus irregularis DAOM 181602=DAOM 197198]CAB5182244.1 unnamed protein product [Rhizophagus irregularis]|eukprot:XP_025169626.1 hypothetical protein GLOIN_2v1882635 [Rhizophagus irregularis DAOM 181602=DAOM 197198]